MRVAALIEPIAPRAVGRRTFHAQEMTGTEIETHWFYQTDDSARFEAKRPNENWNTGHRADESPPTHESHNIAESNAFGLDCCRSHTGIKLLLTGAAREQRRLTLP